MRVASSPYDVDIKKGPSIASNTIAFGEGIERAISGKYAYFAIQAKNEDNENIDNKDDQYQIIFEGPDGTNVGKFYVTANYESNGLYNAVYVPQISGTYSVTITLLGYLSKSDT
jgi:hypothetical protein